MKSKLIRITTIPKSLGSLLHNQMRFMSEHFEVVAVSSPGDVFEPIINDQGVRGVTIEMTRQITPMKDLWALIRLIVLFLREKPAIVHTHTPKAGTLGMIAAWICRVPVRMHTVAGLPLLEATGKRRRLLDCVEWVTYHCAIDIYPNSYGLRDIIIRNGYCSAEKLHVIGNGSSNGIDTSRFAPQVYASSPCFTFIFVGRMVGDKGVNELVRAFVRLAESHSSIRLMMLGSYERELDPIERSVEELIHNHPLISYEGYQQDVRPFFARADALVFPSYREGFPNVVMQAGAMGLPSIVTNINGCNEIIVEGENGVIVPPKDHDALFCAMKRFVEDPELVGRLASKARGMIVERYQQRVVWEALLEEYNRLLAGI